MRLAALALAVVGAVGYASHWWSSARFIEDTDDAYVGADVTVISAKVPGYISEVAVQDNQFVKAGDLLASIDVRDYQAALAKADGAVAAQRARLANLDAVERCSRPSSARPRPRSTRAAPRRNGPSTTAPVTRPW